MKTNESGIFYPIVLLFIVLLSVVITIQADFLIRERRVMKLGGILLQQEYYFKQSMRYLDKQYQLSGELPASGEFLFNHGNVYYDIKDGGEDILIIHLEVEVADVDNVKAIAHYSTSGAEVIKWIEIEK